eukprot:TRINITY_DN24487_c0_g1_i2.p1 TRINITY_DN24487_c0_g1~~TRINITY_DN24487_c0_g1_i2.p1  ORF type:complete len:325 (+),score=39.63 TRINITY_DN24487_c0_g1_i2:34-1008(+)
MKPLSVYAAVLVCFASSFISSHGPTLTRRLCMDMESSRRQILLLDELVAPTPFTSLLRMLPLMFKTRFPYLHDKNFKMHMHSIHDYDKYSKHDIGNRHDKNDPIKNNRRDKKDKLATSSVCVQVNVNSLRVIQNNRNDKMDKPADSSVGVQANVDSLSVLHATTQTDTDALCAVDCAPPASTCSQTLPAVAWTSICQLFVRREYYTCLESRLDEATVALFRPVQQLNIVDSSHEELCDFFENTLRDNLREHLNKSEDASFVDAFTRRAALCCAGKLLSRPPCVPVQPPSQFHSDASRSSAPSSSDARPNRVGKMPPKRNRCNFA